MKYDIKLKQEAINFHKNNPEISLREVAKVYNINYATFYSWINGRKITEESRIKNIENYKKRYIENKINENYSTLGVKIDKELLQEFEEKCEKNGVSKLSVVRNIIENFIGKKESDFN